MEGVTIYISKLLIKNFRSFGSIKENQGRKESPIEINLNNLTLFIGANSTGKTATNNALLKLFSPYRKERLVEEHDFHQPLNEEEQKDYLSIEAILSFPELTNQETSDAIPPHFNQMSINEVGDNPYVRVRLEATLSDKHSIEPIIEQQLQYILSPLNTEYDDEKRKPVSQSERSQIQMFYIPASRKPSTQLKNSSGTIFGRILNGINWPEGLDDDIEKEMETVDELFDDVKGVKSLRSIINKQWSKYHNDSRYSSTSVSFNHSNLDSILKKVEVNFDPSETKNSTKVDQLGDGLQSLFYLSLVNSLLEIEKLAINEKQKDSEEPIFKIDPPCLTLVALEEPENHVSPHLLGRILSGFLELSNQSNAQVTVSTHSPSMIKRIDPKVIRHFRLDEANGASVVRQIELPSKSKESEYKYVKGAVKAYPELYFSNLVILCEGDSEEIIIPRLLELINARSDFSGISIVPLGGKHVNHFWKLLYELKIPYVTLIDLDRERDGGGWGRIKYLLDQLIETGISKDDLLELENGEILSNKAYEDMRNWPLDTKNLESWIDFLEGYGVYFSAPLDVDFVMLEGFIDEYKITIPRNGGPRGLDGGKQSTKYKEKLNKSIRNTLKQNGGDGDTFTVEQLDLMIWYDYFFLGRGKPSTHIEALENVNEEKLNDNLPESFSRFLNDIEKRLR
ncbi:ATP-dependent nuclease [Halobacillus amylolyticus]|uniref:AAA family ATPase n=1 Tax=Halobacillus amylolyticus TaxID=2932259 RepID=A0ABY4H767_9BACI|nr:AAA family ATPase [Halobacillus amylolyticus]UOR10288.1 AAA family ATPase [Halobacillus amylolyticus]